MRKYNKMREITLRRDNRPTYKMRISSQKENQQHIHDNTTWYYWTKENSPRRTHI